jgi:MFS family permease
VFVALFSGGLSDRMGRRPILLASFTTFALTCAVMGALGSVGALVVGFALFGLYKGTSEGVLKAYVVDLVPSELRGTALGAFHTAIGMVMLPGGVIAGLLWDWYGPWATFSFGGVMAVAATVMLLASERRTDARAQPARVLG